MPHNKGAGALLPNNRLLGRSPTSDSQEPAPAGDKHVSLDAAGMLRPQRR